MNVTLKELLSNILPYFDEMHVECFDLDDQSYNDNAAAFLDCQVHNFAFVGEDAPDNIAWIDSLESVESVAEHCVHQWAETPELWVHLKDYRIDSRFSVLWNEDGSPVSWSDM